MAGETEERRAALARRVEDLEAMLRRAGEEQVELRASCEVLESQIASSRQTAEALEGERRQLGEQIEAARQGVAQLRDEGDGLRAALAAERAAREEAERQRALLGEERDALRGEAETLRGDAEGLRCAVAEANGEREKACRLEERVAELGGELGASQQRESVLQNAVNELQELLLKEQTQTASLWSDLERECRLRETSESALAEVRGRVAELQTELQGERDMRESEAETGRVGTDVASELNARLESLTTRLSEVEADRENLQQQVDSLRALKEGLDRECEQLRGRVGRAESGENGKAEVGRLRSKLEELERQQREAAQRHSGAVSGYMMELNQRTELLRQRDAEQQKMAEELAVLQSACDDAVAQLASERQERELLALRLQELEAARGARPRPPAGPEHGLSLVADAALAEKPAQREAPLRGVASLEANSSEEARKPAPAPAAAAPVKTARRVDRQRQPGVVVLLEDDAEIQQCIRSAIGHFPGTRCLPASEVSGPGEGKDLLLAVNLLSRSIDPFAAATDSNRWGVEDPYAFLYSAHAGRGVVLGMVDLFPPPFEPDACATRLLGRRSGLQRLLAVSEDVDTMSGLRDVLGRFGCSTAIAFDGKQALELVPMVKPEIALVDLSLPRGEGIRVINRLRADPSVTPPSIAVLWTKPLNPAETVQHGLRAVREFPLTPRDIEHAFCRLFDSGEAGSAGSSEIRAAG